MKPLHKLILMSSTYRQSATHPLAVKYEEIDPLNHLRWRANIRRLDAEQIRDSILTVSGTLDLEAGGPEAIKNKPRRTIYLRVLRNEKNPLLDVFDAPDGLNSISQRNVTTTALQSLLMINSLWTNQQASLFADRIRHTKLNNGKMLYDKTQEMPIDEQSIEIAYRLAFGRRPTAEERARAMQFLSDAEDCGQENTPLQQQSLVDFCHVLLNSNEFIFVD